MMAGDGYTFWKDAVEIPLVLAHFSIFFWPLPAAALAAGFFFFEAVFGGIIMGPGLEMFFAGYVLWLRAFVRTAGFFSGGFIFLKRYIIRC